MIAPCQGAPYPLHRGLVCRALVALLLITLAAAGLRLFQIGSKGLWLDEAFSVWMARQPLNKMLFWLAKIDQHPPLYYTLLHIWIGAGDGEAAVRMLSAMFSTLTVPVIFLLGQKLAGDGIGLLAALLLTVSPFHISFAQEARMYALLAFNASVAMLATAHLLVGTDHKTLAWSGYVVFTAATILTHNTAVLFFIAINVVVSGLLIIRQVKSSFLRPWLLAQAGTWLLWLPWLPSFLVQSGRVYDEFWIQPPTLGTVAAALKQFVSAFMPDTIGWGHVIWLIYIVLLCTGIYRLRTKPTVLALLLALCLIPFFLELVISLKRPIFYDRTLIWTTVPLYVLLAAGIHQLGLAFRGRSVLLLAAITTCVAINGFSLHEYYAHVPKEQWKEAAAYVAQAVQDDDLLLFNATWVQIPFDYYLAREHRHVEERGIPVDLFDRGILEPRMTASDLLYLRSLIQGRRRVWLIYSHNWYTDPQNLIPPAIAQELDLQQKNSFFGLQVYLYASR